MNYHPSEIYTDFKMTQTDFENGCPGSYGEYKDDTYENIGVLNSNLKSIYEENDVYYLMSNTINFFDQEVFDLNSEKYP